MRCARLLCIALLVAGSSLWAGCEKEQSETTGDKPVEGQAGEASDESGEGDDGAKSDEAALDESGSDEEAAKPPPEKLEEPPSPDPGDTLEYALITDEMPDGIERDGELLRGLRWTDKSGDNILAFFRVSRTKGEELLRGDHLRKADGEWTLVEDYKEIAEDCDGADLTMEPYIDRWSITDYDEDDHYEITFAYSVGCRTDVSPVTHKVLLIEEGKKYGLRGVTAERVSDDKVVGGHYENEDDFEDAPEGFLDKAFRTWRFTVY